MDSELNELYEQLVIVLDDMHDYEKLSDAEKDLYESISSLKDQIEDFNIGL